MNEDAKLKTLVTIMLTRVKAMMMSVKTLDEYRAEAGYGDDELGEYIETNPEFKTLREEAEAIENSLDNI